MQFASLGRDNHVKHILLFLSLFSSAAMAATVPDYSHERCVIAGDSIQTYVYGKDKIGDASQLTASQIPLMTNVSITNMSGGGQRMASGGAKGWGLVENLQAIWYVTGSKQPNCIIIALGTNDWDSRSIGLKEYGVAYRKVIEYSKERGVKVICVPPLWRKNEGEYAVHPDGKWTIAQFRAEAVSACKSEGAYIFDASRIGLTPSDFPDGVHMNANGHKIFVTALVAQMQQWKLWQKKY